MGVEPRAEEILSTLYRAFNARDLEAVARRLHPDVDWPNAWEGGRVAGRDDVLAYWRRQFERISSEVEPRRFAREPDGSVTVVVHQVVREARGGKLVSDSRVCHRYVFEDGLILRMDMAGTP